MSGLRTLITMLAGGTAYAVFANVINGIMHDYPMDGDTKLAFFFIGLALTAKALHELEQRRNLGLYF